MASYRTDPITGERVLIHRTRNTPPPPEAESPNDSPPDVTDDEPEDSTDE